MGRPSLGTKPCSDCGIPVPAKSYDEKQKRYRYPKRCKPCQAIPLGEAHHGWKGGKQVTPNGYVVVLVGERGQRKYVFEHRKIWEDTHGPIPEGGVIHHKNHDRSDNRIENLQLIRSPADHTRLHWTLPDGEWSRDHSCCVQCGTTTRRHWCHGLCTVCYARESHKQRPPRVYKPYTPEQNKRRAEQARNRRALRRAGLTRMSLRKARP